MWHPGYNPILHPDHRILGTVLVADSKHHWTIKWDAIKSTVSDEIEHHHSLNHYTALRLENNYNSKVLLGIIPNRDDVGLSFNLDKLSYCTQPDVDSSPDYGIHLLTNLQNNTNIHVQLPDSTTLSSTTHTGILNIPQLSTTARTAHLLPGLQNTSLMSLGQLADDGCVILLTKNHLNVFKNFESILQGDTLIHAIRNNHLLGWPGLTIENVNKYLTETPATAKGHLDQHRQNTQSTKTINKPYYVNNDILPTTETWKKSNQALATIVNHSTNTHKAYFDLTGQFSYVSTRGYKYIFILYDYDSNAILAEPLKTRNASEIKNAWNKLHLNLSNC